MEVFFFFFLQHIHVNDNHSYKHHRISELVGTKKDHRVQLLKKQMYSSQTDKAILIVLHVKTFEIPSDTVMRVTQNKGIKTELDNHVNSSIYPHI